MYISSMSDREAGGNAAYRQQKIVFKRDTKKNISDRDGDMYVIESDDIYAGFYDCNGCLKHSKSYRKGGAYD